VAYVPHRDDEYFGHDRRGGYFDALKLPLDHALLFFDPDIGIEIKNMSSMKRSGLHKYLFKSDIRRVCEFAPASTLFVAYQHVQTDKRTVPSDLLVCAHDLAMAADPDDVMSVRDGDVAFLIGSRDSGVYDSARNAALQHATKHGRECQVHSRTYGSAPTSRPT